LEFDFCHATKHYGVWFMWTQLGLEPRRRTRTRPRPAGHGGRQGRLGDAPPTGNSNFCLPRGVRRFVSRYPAAVAETGIDRANRRVHPCVVPFLTSCVWIGCAAVTAAVSHSALWLLLVLPALPSLFILGGNIALGYPKTDAEAAQRFIHVLDEILGEQWLGVSVQEQTASPCVLQRGRRPKLIVALGLVRTSSDEVLRGVSALQCASLRSPRMNNRYRFARVAFLLAIVAVAFLAAHIAPRAAAPFAVFASIPLTTWLTGVLLAAWSNLDSAGSFFVSLDAAAVELAGGAAAVTDGLLAMDAWLKANRAARISVERAAYRCLQPIRPSAHTTSRVARLRAETEAI
jgi:hypothetical protein